MKKLLMFILPFLFIVNNCGGGSSLENTLPLKPYSSEMAKITKDNSDNIALSSFKTAIGVKDLNNITNINARLNSSKLKSLKSFRAISLRLINKKVVDGYCDSGSVDVNNIDENTAEVNYYNCIRDGITYDGYAKITKYSSSAKLEFKEFDVYKNSEKLSIKSAEFLVDNNRFEIKSMYSNYKNSNEDIDFLNYNSTILIDEDNNLIIVSVDGYIKTKCTKGYVYLKTVPEIKLFTDSSGFIEGALEVSANGKKVSLIFSDDTVNITDVDGISTTITLDDFYDLEDSLYCN